MLNRAKTLVSASQRGTSSPFMVMDVMSAAATLEAAGRDIIHMEVGQPAAPTPLHVREVAAKALMDGQIGYTLALGMNDLRARIADHYSETYGVSLSPERVAVTIGSSGAFILSFLALFDLGQRVAIATPCYPAYRNILEALGLEVVFIKTDASTRWCITPDMLEAEHKKKPIHGLLVASPANPTGTMMSPKALQDLTLAADRLGIRFISDEIYHGLTYGLPQETALKFSDNVTVINSFSKYFCMTGWRIGWMVLPQTLVRPVECLTQNLFISPPKLSQIAALAAFDAKDELETIKDGYEKNRHILLKGLPQAGFDRILPVDGAFYIYADIGNLTNDAMAFSQAMLNEAGIAATPGHDFDPFHGAQALRFSFAGSTARMTEAVERLKRWVRVVD